MAKSEALKIAQIEERRANTAIAVNALLKLLSYPLTAGLLGYGAVSALSTIKKSDGEPYMRPVTSATLKGVAAGYPLAAALGGFAGLAAAGGVAAAVGIAESQPTYSFDLSDLPRETINNLLPQSLQGLFGR